jgi:hypothetical protein
MCNYVRKHSNRLLSPAKLLEVFVDAVKDIKTETKNSGSKQYGLCNNFDEYRAVVSTIEEL